MIHIRDSIFKPASQASGRVQRTTRPILNVHHDSSSRHARQTGETIHLTTRSGKNIPCRLHDTPHSINMSFCSVSYSHSIASERVIPGRRAQLPSFPSPPNSAIKVRRAKPHVSLSLKFVHLMLNCTSTLHGSLILDSCISCSVILLCLEPVPTWPMVRATLTGPCFQGTAALYQPVLPSCQLYSGLSGSGIPSAPQQSSCSSSLGR